MYPLEEASSDQKWYYIRSSWHLVSLWVRLTCSDVPFSDCLSIAFLISDDKCSSLKVVPWCSNTSDWWWKDMCKLVWREHSPYNISLHWVQEYVIRQHRYKTANGHYHISDQPKAWQVDILSHGWLAGQLQLTSWLAGWLPITQNVNLTLPATTYLTNPEPDRLISCHMAGWLANSSWQAGWMADCLLHKMSTWPSPRERHVVAMCVTTLVTKTCGQMYPSSIT